MRWLNKTIYMATLCTWLFQIADAANAQAPTTQPKNWRSEARDTIEQPTGVVEDPFRNQVEYEEHEFVSRLNKLMEALREFSATYNSGSTINVKRVKAVRKAMRELERSQWFRPYKGE